MTTTPDTLAKLAPKLSDKLITLLKCLPEAPFKEHLKAEIYALAAQQAQFAGTLTGIAARKLADLADQGYRVNGYSLMHAETRARGFIDSGGFVGWWSNRDHEQAAQATAGWVMVPPVATDEMWDAFFDAGQWQEGYTAMLAALPQPQPQSAQSKGDAA